MLAARAAPRRDSASLSNLVESFFGGAARMKAPAGMQTSRLLTGLSHEIYFKVAFFLFFLPALDFQLTPT